jgi:hypothetical protein
MAGDIAGPAGLPIVLGTDDLRGGYDDINALADAVATRTPPIFVQPGEPLGAPVGSLWFW